MPAGSCPRAAVGLYHTSLLVRVFQVCEKNCPNRKHGALRPLNLLSLLCRRVQSGLTSKLVLLLLVRVQAYRHQRYTNKVFAVLPAPSTASPDVAQQFTASLSDCFDKKKERQLVTMIDWPFFFPKLEKRGKQCHKLKSPVLFEPCASGDAPRARERRNRHTVARKKIVNLGGGSCPWEMSRTTSTLEALPTRQLCPVDCCPATAVSARIECPPRSENTRPQSLSMKTHVMLAYVRGTGSMIFPLEGRSVQGRPAPKGSCDEDKIPSPERLRGPQGTVILGNVAPLNLNSRGVLRFNRRVFVIIFFRSVNARPSLFPSMPLLVNPTYVLARFVFFC